MSHATFLKTSIAAMALVIAMGCAKKVTKVESTPKADTQTQQSQPDYKAADPDNFVPQEPDSRMKDLLVPIYFDYDDFSLRKDAISSLEKIAPLFQENPNLKLLAEGHADERGSSEYNMGLGEKRSSSVKKWFASYGIPESKIEITSYGKERPARPNCESDDCHVLNRRVEWKVIGK